MFAFISNQFKKLPKCVRKTIAIIMAILLICYVVLFVSKIFKSYSRQNDAKTQNGVISSNAPSNYVEPQKMLDLYEEAKKNSGEQYVEFIDVGQADCTLVVNKDTIMLIDAGNNEDGEYIVAYLKQLGISKIDYLVGTHPHEDHIGGLDNIIESFEIGVLLMPDVSTDLYTYESVVSAAKDHDVEIRHPAVGEQWGIGDATCTVLSNSAIEDVTDLNEWSLVLHLDTNKLDFLFMGDAQICNENAIIESGLNFKADVLRVSHHGSSDANSEKFIRMASPTYSITSVGVDNEYNHPHKEVLEQLREVCQHNARTDRDGTFKISFYGKYELVEISCDGNRFEKKD